MIWSDINSPTNYSVDAYESRTAPIPSFQSHAIGIFFKKNPVQFQVINDLLNKKLNQSLHPESLIFHQVYYSKNAIFFIQELGQGFFLSKVNIYNAFRLIPVASSQWMSLGIF